MARREVLIVLAVLLATQPAPAEENLRAEKAATLAARAGLGAAKLWMDHESLTIPRSTLDPLKQSAAIEESLKRYSDTRNAYSGLKTGGEAVKGAMQIVIGGAMISAGPQAGVTVPLTLLAAASSLTMDLTNRQVERIGEERARNLLASIKDDLVEKSGARDYEALRGNPDLLRKTLRDDADFLRDVKTRASSSGDQGLLDVAVDAIAESAIATDVETLVSISQIGVDLETVDRRLGEFIEEAKESSERIEAALDEHTKAVKDIGDSVVNLGNEIDEVSSKMDQLGANQDLIADFMFSGLPAAEKARALRSGLMDGRIACPADAVDCDPSEVKEALISRFDAETRVTENIQTAEKVLKGINDVTNIADNLGIDLGEDGQKVAEVAATAVNAYIGFMAGDYLGAIGSITGMFGKKPDPDAERFKIMMGYLKEQFGVINEKLEAILKNQKIILEAVLDLSKQLETTYVALDGRLDQMQFEQRQIADNVKALVWRDWEPCNNVFSFAVNPNPTEGAPPLVELQTLRFPSFEAARTVVDERSTSTAECLNVVSNSLATLTATKWFGNFLDANRSFGENAIIDPGTLDAALVDETNKWRSDFRVHREHVVDPAMSISAAYASRHGISPATLLYLNTSSIPDTKTLHQVATSFDGGNLSFSCGSADPSVRAIRGLVCMPGRSADVLASELSSTVLNTDILLDIADWMVVVSQLADLYDEPAKKFASSLTEMASMPKSSRGEEILLKLTDVFSLSIAYHTRLHGGLTALAIAEDVRDGRADDRHMRVLTNNPYLAENTANILLHMIRGSWNFGSDPAKPAFGDRYTQAYLHSRTDSADRFEPLYALFGRERTFDLMPKGFIGISVATSAGNVLIPLPAPTRLNEGRFVYPARRDVLVTRKERMVERYLDYQFGNDEQLARIVLPQ